MNAGEKSSSIRFPSLERIRLREGATKTQFSTDARVSRGTMDKILSGKLVKTGTVASILKALEASGYDVSDCWREFGSSTKSLVSSPVGPTLAVVHDSSAQNGADFANAALTSLEAAQRWLLQLEDAVKDKDTSVDLNKIAEIENLTNRISLYTDAIVSKARS